MAPRRVDLDLYNVLLGFGWARERGELIEATIDPRFLLRARRALFPLPIVDRPKVVDAADVLPPFRRRPVTAFEGKRVALIAGGGAGACVSLVGVRRAFEEAGVEPALMTACSGGTIWGSMWAAGMSAEQMTEFLALVAPGGLPRHPVGEGASLRRRGVERVSPALPRARRSNAHSTSASAP